MRNDVIDETALITYISNNLQKEWKLLANQSITYCMSTISTVKVSKAVKLTTGRSCSVLPTLLIQCFIKEIKANCPSSAQISSQQCLRSRASFNYCDAFAKTEYGGFSGRTRSATPSRLSNSG
ncbi:uncharacterized protein LOC132201487 [Neocloeon triangulifer]|uniref:uncharacterized protein LOC132201487 n=1 Tax=Neocloeon triangulifer TaxID=2078957 RepID=UPI00286F4BAC|nr:uncharacterized protein LOC132201487 [Neocloeon triangulifer]